MTTEARFLKDVESHVMEIIKEDGLHRHIRFRKPGTMCMHFDLITWPGYLCYTGDMGTYVFRRLDDMFQFFRTDREYAQSRGKQLGINADYWAEKLQAVDGSRRANGVKEYSPERFSKIVKEQLVNWMRESNLSREERRELRDQVESEVLWKANDGEVRAFDAANEFTVKVGGQKFQFSDFWEHDFTKYTHRFLWCCYALAWSIQKYDEYKEATNAPEPEHA